MTDREIEYRVLAAVAYGIRRQRWGESILDQAFGYDAIDVGAVDVEQAALDALDRLAKRSGLDDFDSRRSR
jgi:hypothetical protein